MNACHGFVPYVRRALEPQVKRFVRAPLPLGSWVAPGGSRALGILVWVRHFVRPYRVHIGSGASALAAPTIVDCRRLTHTAAQPCPVQLDPVLVLEEVIGV